MKKYTLVRLVSEALVIVMLANGATHISTQRKYPKEVYPYTQEDHISNVQFNAELEALYEIHDYEFQNKELASIIETELGGLITEEALNSIRTIDILNPLTNNDLSELKHLPNLAIITIHDNEVDLSDLKYNQNLYTLALFNCKVSNTQDLPNSTNSIFFEDTIVEDKEFVVPYYTEHIQLIKTIANNMRLKTPDNLEELFIASDVILDCNIFKDCKNLKSLTILMCSNIRNASVLGLLPSLEKVILDEYSSIWLDNNTLKNLPITEDTDVLQLLDLNEKLDSIASKLVPDKSISDEDKIKAVIIYVLEKLKYDQQSIDDKYIDEDSTLVNHYNRYPLSTSIEGDDGICINYASLFQALCNRVGIESYQLLNDVHAWNAAKVNNEYIGYDLTYLDQGPLVNVIGDKPTPIKTGELAIIGNMSTEELIRKDEEELLHYYGFDIQTSLDDDHIADYIPQEIKQSITNIGYINPNSTENTLYNTRREIHKLETSLRWYMILTLITATYESLRAYKTLTKKRIENEEIEEI